MRSRMVLAVLGCICIARGSIGLAHQPSPLLVVIGIALTLRAVAR